MSKTDVTYIISHGFAARMVMQTDLLGKLVEKGLKVGIIVPDAKDQLIVNYCNEKKISLYEFNSKSEFLSNYYTSSRKYFLEDIDKNTALLEKHIWDTKYNPTKNPLGFIRPRLLYLIYKLNKKFPNIRNWYKSRERKHLISKEAKTLIETIDTNVLIATYPVNFSEAMLLYAGNEKNSCKTIIHLLSWDNISCKGHFPELADEYIAWGPIMRSEFIEYYNISPEKIHDCGVPHFDLHKESKLNPNFELHLEKLGLNPKGEYLFFAMSSPRFAPHEIDIVEWLANQVTQGVFGDGMQLIVRPHPQNIQGSMADTSWIPRLHALQTDVVKVDFPDILMDSGMSLSMQKNDMIRLSQLLTGARLCLNSGSTVSIDALVCGIPVVLTSFDAFYELEYWKSARRLIDFNHLKKMVMTDGVSVAHNFESLTLEIKSYLIDKNRNLEKREQLLRLECSNENMNATERVVDLLYQKCIN